MALCRPGPLHSPALIVHHCCGEVVSDFYWRLSDGGHPTPPPPLSLFTVRGVVCFRVPDYMTGVLLLNRIRVPKRLVRYGRLPTDHPHANPRRIGDRRQRSVSLAWLTSYRSRRSVAV